jgi:ATP-binding cassette subfamily F protein uup
MLPSKIEELEQEIADLEQALSDPDLYAKNPQAFQDKTRRMDHARDQLEESETRWLELQLLQEEISG